MIACNSIVIGALGNSYFMDVSIIMQRIIIASFPYSQPFGALMKSSSSFEADRRLFSASMLALLQLTIVLCASSFNPRKEKKEFKTAPCSLLQQIIQ